MDSSEKALQTVGKLFFKNRIRFRFCGRKPKFFQTNSKAITEFRFYPKYLMLYINGFV